MGRPQFDDLTTLLVQGNRIRDRGLQLLVERTRLPSLTHLDLSFNYIRDEGLRLLEASSLLARLRWLDLLAASPRLASLRHLNLRGNRFSFAALQHLAQSPYITAPCDVIVTTYNLTAAQQQQLQAQYNGSGLFVSFT